MCPSFVPRFGPACPAKLVIQLLASRRGARCLILARCLSTVNYPQTAPSRGGNNNAAEFGKKVLFTESVSDAVEFLCSFPPAESKVLAREFIVRR